MDNELNERNTLLRRERLFFVTMVCNSLCISYNSLILIYKIYSAQLLLNNCEIATFSTPGRVQGKGPGYDNWWRKQGNIMAPFRFRLEQVLRYRVQLEDQAKQALAGAQTRHEAAAKELAALLQTLAEQQAVLSQAGGLTPDELWLALRYAELVRFDVAQAEQREQALSEEVQQCRVELGEKAKERKLLDKLKEKQAVKHAAEERLQEERVFDETATIRHNIQSF